MEKEKLTKELILIDIRYSQKHYTPKKSLQANNFIFYGGLFVVLLVFFITKSLSAFLLLMIPACYFLITFLLKHRNRKQLSENDISVSSDRLASVEKRLVDVGGKFARYQTKVLLAFEGGSEWEIPYENYTWSKTFKMSRKGIENTSLQRDSFYLVRLNENVKIAVAYNQKFFVYQES